MRIYVLVTCCDPLRIFLYDDGLIRMATVPYLEPKTSNIQNTFMHLTNYAINKNNENFVFNEKAEDDFTGSKRSIKKFYSWLENQGHDAVTLKLNIKRIINKTLISGSPFLKHYYRTSHTEDYQSAMCFEVLGYGFLVEWVILIGLIYWLIRSSNHGCLRSTTPPVSAPTLHSTKKSKQASSKTPSHSSTSPPRTKKCSSPKRRKRYTSAHCMAKRSGYRGVRS